jgi:hypothetical protein
VHDGGVTYAIDQRVVVLDNPRTRMVGIAGRHGRVTGMSPRPGTGTGTVAAYGVLFDGSSRTHPCEPADLAPEDSVIPG